MRLLTEAEYAEESERVEDELIEQYLEDELSEEERAQFARSFLKTSGRKDKLAAAAARRQGALGRAAPGSRPAALSAPHAGRRALRDFLPTVGLKAAAVVAVALGVGLAGWLVVLTRTGESRGLAALRQAYKNQRLIEARVTSLGYAPLFAARGADGPAVDEAALRQAELQLLNALDERPGAAAHHDLGRFYLAGRQFDKAVAHLEAAAKLEPDNARLRSDLGAALLEKGKAELEAQGSGKSLEYFARSLGEMDRALELDASLLEAHYNRAVVHQQMMLPRQSEDDWRKYLEKDSGSPWAAEARRSLELLEEKRRRPASPPEQTLAAFLGAAESADDEAAWTIYTGGHTSRGNAITNALLDSVLDAPADGDTGRRSARALAYLADLELRRTGDRYTTDLARFYAAASARQRAAVSGARRRVRAAYELFARSKVSEAAQAFALAAREFEQAGDTAEALFAGQAVAHCYAVQPDIVRGLSVSGRVTPACESRAYWWLLAQSLRVKAHLQLNLSDYSAALDSGARALGFSQQVHDHDGQLRSLTQLADMHQSLNDNEKSLEYLRRGQTIAQDLGAAPTQTWGIYIALAFNFNALGHYRAALDYQREALQIALAAGRPLYVSRSYEYVGLTYGNLRRYDEAVEHVRLAYQQGQALSNDPNGVNMMASASLKLGDLHRAAGDHARAVAAYDESIGLYDGLRYYHYSYSAHRGKLLSYLAQGDDARASEELRTVLGLFEQYRGKITEERHRNTFFDNEQSVYDLAIDFELSRRGDPRRAFDYSESSRARSLLDLMRNGGQVVEKDYGPDMRAPHGSVPLTLSEIQERLPEQAQLLQYAVLDDKLLIWSVSKTDFSHRVVDIDARALGARVADYLRQVAGAGESDAAASAETARALYDVLLKPVEELLDPRKLLCIVPDKVLSYVPFGALVSGATGRHLIEDYRLTLAPSATVFIDCSDAAKRRGDGRDEKLLSVGDPAFDRGAFPRLPGLPSAAREAEAISAYYRSPEPHVLLRERARAGQVKAGLGRADVAHLAAHYVIDRGSNMRSKLVLAKEPAAETHGGRTGGALEPWEVYQMRLPLTRLVVLSGCQTGIERQYGGEGAISFARPFIAAGVPLVVASLWPVDSDATTDLMISFHRHRKRDRLPTAEALRRAQLEMLAHPDPRFRRPYYWAPFVTIGGHAEF